MLSGFVIPVGQWGLIVTTVGSLYLILVVDVEAGKEEAPPDESLHDCSCSHHHHDGSGQIPTVNTPTGVDDLPIEEGTAGINRNMSESSQNVARASAVPEAVHGSLTIRSFAQDTTRSTYMQSSFPDELFLTPNRSRVGQRHQDNASMTSRGSSRRVVAKTLIAFGSTLR